MHLKIKYSAKKKPNFSIKKLVDLKFKLNLHKTLQIILLNSQGSKVN